MEQQKENLTNEELAVLARNKDSVAMEKLVILNEGFVVFMALGFLKHAGFNDCFSTGLIEDYEQICRLSIWKAVAGFDEKKGTKFMTYAGTIMRNTMLRQVRKDFREKYNTAGTFDDDYDTYLEEADEEYGDAYDNAFEDAKSEEAEDMLPSMRMAAKKEQLMETVTIDEVQAPDNKETLSRINSYFGLLGMINKDKNYEEGSELIKELERDPDQTEKSKTDGEKSGQLKYRGIYNSPKKYDHSWAYPIYHKVILKLQTEAMLEALLSSSFDKAQRKLLIYHYGLEDLNPKTMKDTREHFNLSEARAKNIETEGLRNLEYRLWKKKLMLL